MRIVVLIISLGLMLVIGLQSCTVGIGGSIVKDEGMSQGGAVGLLIAFMYLIGAAFSLGKPVVSMVVFILAGLLGFMVSATTSFSDMGIWGGISLVLAIFSFFGKRDLLKKKKVHAQKEFPPENDTLKI